MNKLMEKPKKKEEEKKIPVFWNSGKLAKTFSLGDLVKHPNGEPWKGAVSCDS